LLEFVQFFFFEVGFLLLEIFVGSCGLGEALVMALLFLQILLFGLGQNFPSVL